MQTNTARLSFEDTADLMAALHEHPEQLTRQQIGAMEYVTGNTGTHAVALCVDTVTGESVRLS